MTAQKNYFENFNRIMKFIANFLKAAYYAVKFLNFEP